MEIKISEDKKNRLVFDVVGGGHTLCGALKKELWNDEHVKAAGYNIAHPLINTPRMVLETDGADPRKTVLAAVKRLDKLATKLESDAAKLK